MWKPDRIPDFVNQHRRSLADLVQIHTLQVDRLATGLPRRRRQSRLKIRSALFLMGTSYQSELSEVVNVRQLEVRNCNICNGAARMVASAAFDVLDIRTRFSCVTCMEGAGLPPLVMKQ